MTPFPAPGFTFREFAEYLRTAKLCSVTRIEDIDGDGNAALYRYIRVEPGAIYDIIDYVEDDTWPMTGHAFRSLCARLNLTELPGGIH